jgi:hypothetical protein
MSTLDTDFFAPLPGELIWAAHQEVLSRATGTTGVVNGNRISPSNPESMDINVAPGRIRVAGEPVDTEASTKTLDASHSTLDRIDLVLRDLHGKVQIVKGVPAIRNDPKGLSPPNWHQFDSPIPLETIPEGAILGAIYVAAGSKSISSNEIWMFAGRVLDYARMPIVNRIGAPGSDSVVPSEAAVRTKLDTKFDVANIVKTISNPGLDSKVPSENVVRSELNSKISTSSIATTIADPGLDTKIPTEKAVRSNLNQKVNVSDIVTTLGFPGSDSKVPSEMALRKLLDKLRIGSIQAVIDGGELPIQAGNKVDIIIDYPCTILGWRLVAEPVPGQQAGSIVIDIWNEVQASHLPTASKTITGDAKPAIHNGNQAIGPTDAWKTGLEEGDVLRINVESCTNLKRATLSLKVAKNL